MQSVIKLQPVFKEMIWGSTTLHDVFNFDLPSINVGEAWIASAHNQGVCTITNGQLKDKKLDQVFFEYRESFGPGGNKSFPILIKIIDAHQDLSVQVHPDDTYAKNHENGVGKYESWIMLHTQQNAKLCIGHHANDNDEFKEMMSKKQYDKLFRYIPISKGDCFDIVPGTVHAICEGTLVYECQQNSNITYRIYDYDRKDVNGNKRELHIDKALDVIKAPDKPNAVQLSDVNQDTPLIKNPYFSLFRKTVTSQLEFNLDEVFIAITNIEGSGTINGIELRKGDTVLVLPDAKSVKANGDMELLIAQPSLESMR